MTTFSPADDFIEARYLFIKKTDLLKEMRAKGSGLKMKPFLVKLLRKKGAVSLAPLGFLSFGKRDVRLRDLVRHQVQYCEQDVTNIGIGLQSLSLPAVLLFDLASSICEPFSNLLYNSVVWKISTASKHYIEKRICPNCLSRPKQARVLPCQDFLCFECAGQCKKTKQCSRCQKTVKSVVLDMRKLIADMEKKK